MTVALPANLSEKPEAYDHAGLRILDPDAFLCCDGRIGVTFDVEIDDVGTWYDVVEWDGLGDFDLGAMVDELCESGDGSADELSALADLFEARARQIREEAEVRRRDGRAVGR